MDYESTLTGFANPNFQPKKSSPPPIEAGDIVQQVIRANNVAAGLDPDTSLEVYRSIRFGRLEI